MTLYRTDAGTGISEHPVMTPKQVGEVLQLSANTVRAMARRGELRYRMAGPQMRIYTASVECLVRGERESPEDIANPPRRKPSGVEKPSWQPPTMVVEPDIQNVRLDRQALYVMHWSDMYKVGISKQPYERLNTLKNGGALPSVRVVMVYHPMYQRARLLEQECHKALEDFRADGEWFKGDHPLILKTVVDTIARLDFDW